MGCLFIVRHLRVSNSDEQKQPLRPGKSPTSKVNSAVSNSDEQKQPLRPRSRYMIYQQSIDNVSNSDEQKQPLRLQIRSFATERSSWVSNSDEQKQPLR